VALLVALGADPAQAAGGVLLFTISTHLLEIPFGVLAWLIWMADRNRNHPGPTDPDGPLTPGTHPTADLTDGP
jgi:putative heme transporter